jgi:hypothetical protein
LFFIALLAFYFNPDEALAPGRGYHPGMVGPGGIMAYMALMAAAQHRDPVTDLILVKTDDFLFYFADIHDLARISYWG